MAEEKKVGSFKYYVEDCKRVFPLDYSQKEIEDTQKLREGSNLINRTTLRNRVCENQLFRDFFHWMRYDEPWNGEVYANAIPLELLPFFKLYIQEIISDGRFAKSIEKSDGHGNDGKGFYNKLLQYSREEEQKRKIDESEFYWTRQLYENIEFQASVVESLWENEYMLRVQGLNEMIRELTPTQQLEMFQIMINHLDNEIVMASRYKKRDVENKANGERSLVRFLQTFPQSVISKCRKRVVMEKSGKPVYYDVDDIQLSEPVEFSGKKKDSEQIVVRTMQDAFRKISGNVKNSVHIKKAARRDYCRKLNQEAAKSSFQIDYENAVTYLNICVEDYDLKKIRQQIEQRAITYYGAAFRGENAAPGMFRSNPDGSWPQGEINGMIESLILGNYNSFCAFHSHWVGFIADTRYEVNRRYNYFKNIERLVAEDPGYAENKELYEREKKSYLAYLREIMPSKFLETFVVGEKISDEQELPLAEKIVSTCNEAATKLGAVPFEWLNVARMRDCIYRYNWVLTAEVGLQYFPGFNEHDVNLCQALILCNIAEKYDNCCKDVEEYIVLLTKAVKEMKKH